MLAVSSQLCFYVKSKTKCLLVLLSLNIKSTMRMGSSYLKVVDDRTQLSAVG